MTRMVPNPLYPHADVSRLERELRDATEYAVSNRSALERARGCIKGLLARTPVRDVEETLAEIDAALAKNPNSVGHRTTEPSDAPGTEDSGPVWLGPAKSGNEIGAMIDGLDYSVILDQMAKCLQSASCPNPLCVDGSIRNTGPDPQDDACEWCYARHELISLSTYGREVHSQGGVSDTQRLDWLEKEMERELTCTTHLVGRRQGISLFRRNVPITRAAIDEAMSLTERKP